MPSIGLAVLWSDGGPWPLYKPRIVLTLAGAAGQGLAEGPGPVSRLNLAPMPAFALDIVLFAAAFAFMEAFAWFTHRYVMHGLLWVWHRSHHQPRAGVFELNDLFAVVFAVPAVAAIWLGVHGAPPLLPVGLGITAYGVVYSMFHDGLVHRRYPVPLGARSRFWKRLIQAHRIHHAVATREGCVSFGFLYAQPIRKLKAQLAGQVPPRLGDPSDSK